MWNKHFFKTQVLLAALAATVIVPVSLFSQQKSAARTATTIKDSDIYVPDKALEPSYTKKEASDLLKEYIAAFSDTDMPRTYEAFAKEPDKYKRIGARQIKTALGNLYNYVKDPEIQEVTGASDEWFRNLYNKALELNEPATLMDKAIRLKNATMYTQATKAYAEKIDELNKFVKKGPDRISAEKLAQLKEANRARRRADYIAQRKQYLIEQEEAAKQALEEELKKAKASTSKKN